MPIAGRDLRLLRPRDAEALLDEEAFEREEFLPYWAELWPSSLALARAIAGRALRGARTLELGCGLGLPSIAAALAGGRVLATDWSAEAVAMTAANAERNDAAVETLVCSWTAPEPLLARAPWDLVLASDVLYEARNGDVLLELLPRLGRRGLARRPRPPAGGPLPRGRRQRLGDQLAARARAGQGRRAPAAPDSARGDVQRARGDRAGRRTRCRTAPSNFSASPAAEHVHGPVEIDLDRRRARRTAAPRPRWSRPPRATSGRPRSTRARASRCRPTTGRARRCSVSVPSPARTIWAVSGRGALHSAPTGTSSASAIRSTEPTLGRARPRSSWLRNGCESPALRPSAFRVRPRSWRSSRTRAPRHKAASLTLICSPSA